MTLPPDDSDFDGLDPETKFRIESLVAKPVGKVDAGNPQVWFWFDGRGRELPLDSTSGPSFTGAPVMISRIILLAVIAIISVAAYFAGSGAFRPYSAKLFDLFSQRTSSAPASLSNEETLAAAATNSDHDQLPPPNDFSRSPERPLAETQTQTPVAAAKSMAAPQATASVPEEEVAAATTTSEHDKVSAPNDLSRSPERPVADTQMETPVATAKSTAAPSSGPAAVLSAGSIDSVPANALANRGFQALPLLATFHLGSRMPQNRLFRA
jgi:hypothetical protein